MRYIKIIDHKDGTEHLYPVRDLSEMTVRQWLDLTIPPLTNTDDFRDELEETYHIAHRYAGIPRDVLRQIPMSSLRTMFEALEVVALQAKEERQEDKAIPTTVDFGGVTYAVPHDLGSEMTLGQYVDICARLERLTTEDEGIAVVLAVMLNESGKAYDGTDIEGKITAFMDFPANLAIRLTGFFFAGNAELMECWSRCMSKRLTSKLQAMQQALSGSESVMDGTPPSSALPASSPPLTPSTGTEGL
jgi:hypothetical protein